MKNIYRYSIILDTADGDSVIMRTTAPDIMTAHAHAADLAAEYAAESETPVDRVRVFADTTDSAGQMDDNGILESVAIIVRRKTANMLGAEAGTLQYRLWREARNPKSDDPDLLDLRGEAAAALVNAIADGLAIDEQYRAAYRAIDRYLWSSRAVNLNKNAMKTMYLEDVNGELVSVNKQIAAIMRPADRYNPTYDIAKENAAETAGNTAAVLAALAAEMTTIQREIAVYLAKGWSVRQIAAATRRKPSTIQDHINAIRKKARAMFPDVAAAVNHGERRRALAEAARQQAEEARYFDTDIWH